MDSFANVHRAPTMRFCRPEGIVRVLQISMAEDSIYEYSIIVYIVRKENGPVKD